MFHDEELERAHSRWPSCVIDGAETDFPERLVPGDTLMLRNQLIDERYTVIKINHQINDIEFYDCLQVISWPHTQTMLRIADNLDILNWHYVTIDKEINLFRRGRIIYKIGVRSER